MSPLRPGVISGTETGHASGTYCRSRAFWFILALITDAGHRFIAHANGYKFDFHHTTALDNYIKSGLRYLFPRVDSYDRSAS
jgi:hypothetical protein